MTSGPTRFRLHRPLDMLVAVVGLLATWPLLVAAWAAAGWTAKGSGLFRQTRVGRNGSTFEIVKFRTMYAGTTGTTVTTARDNRITSVGRLLRTSKLDEVPQLINVLRGEMALLGPRPDVPGFADRLDGEDRSVLAVRPGVTGPASLACTHEERLLESATNPEVFNSETLYPLKTAINRAWIEHGTIADDIRLLLWTVRSPRDDKLHTMIHRWAPSLSLDALEPIG